MSRLGNDFESERANIYEFVCFQPEVEVEGQRKVLEKCLPTGEKRHGSS